MVESGVPPVVETPQAVDAPMDRWGILKSMVAAGRSKVIHHWVYFPRTVIEMPEIVVIAEPLKDEATHVTDTIYKEVVKEVAPVEMETLRTTGVEMVEPVIEVPKEIGDGNNIETSIERPVIETDRVGIERSTIENNEISTVVYTARPENERGKQGLVQTWCHRDASRWCRFNRTDGGRRTAADISAIEKPV